MSTILSISFLAKNKDNYLRVYENLNQWVCEKCDVGELNKLYWNSATLESNLVDSLNPENVIESKNQFALDFTYKKNNPYEINGSLLFSGNDFDYGNEVKNNGNIRIRLNERFIWGSFNRHFSGNEEYEKLVEHRVSVLLGLSELFNEWVDLCEGLLDYASFYTESGVPVGPTSTMAYYRDYDDFILDYIRLLLESKLDLSLIEFYGNEQEYFRKPLGEIKNTFYYESFEEKNGQSLINFINDLSLDNINVLNGLDKQTIKETLENVLKKNHDFLLIRTKEGFTLSTYPLSSLWPIYLEFIKELNINE